jgi:hypothetical protein
VSIGLIEVESEPFVFTIFLCGVFHPLSQKENQFDLDKNKLSRLCLPFFCGVLHPHSQKENQFNPNKNKYEISSLIFDG